MSGVTVQQRSLFDTCAPDRQAWLDTAQPVLEWLAGTGDGFTADTLRAHGVPEPPYPNMWGQFFGGYARRHKITSVGFVHSTREARKGSILQAWRGC